ncbi:MAG: hypothetical protein QOF39_2426, partial [Frankiales bacterium]|nr:hypothetical protein [Frankiales bacterium]
AADRFWVVAAQLADALESAAVVVAVGGLLLGSSDDGWASWALLAVAAAALLSTIRASRRVGLPGSVAVALVAMTLLPFAQHLPVGPAVAVCVALTALSVIGACVLAGRSGWQPVAAVLAAGSLGQTVASIGATESTRPYLTVALSLLCLVFAGVAVLSDRRLGEAGVAQGYRSVATGVSSALLLGAVASGCHDRGVTTAVTALVVTLVAAALAAGATLLEDRQPDSTVVEVVSALAAFLALPVAAARPVLAGWVLAVAGLTILFSATRADRRASWPVGALLISAASWMWLGVAGVTAPEPYTDPIAVVALCAGFARRRRLPATPSLTAYGPGLSGLLLPSLSYALLGDGLVRPLLLGALATGVVIVGAQHRLRAPLLLGSGTLVLTALRLLAPYEVLVPRWLEVGTAGALLLTLGATYEQRRRDLGTLRARYDALL